MKDLILTTKIAVYSYSELTAEYKKIVDAAKEATKRSYSPYSKFCVGAALQLDNGEILTGANQENAAFTAGTCAERSVIFYAGANYPGVPCRGCFHKGRFCEESGVAVRPLPPSHFGIRNYQRRAN